MHEFRALVTDEIKALIRLVMHFAKQDRNWTCSPKFVIRKKYTRHGTRSMSVRVCKKNLADLGPRTDGSAVRISLVRA